MASFVNFLDSNHSNIDKLHYDYFYITTQREHKGVQKPVCFIIYALNLKKYSLLKYFKGTLYKDIGKKILKMNLKEDLQEDIYFQNIISTHNPFTKTQL